jgi:hypothetical protein
MLKHELIKFFETKEDDGILSGVCLKYIVDGYKIVKIYRRNNGIFSNHPIYFFRIYDFNNKYIGYSGFTFESIYKIKNNYIVIIGRYDPIYFLFQNKEELDIFKIGFRNFKPDYIRLTENDFDSDDIFSICLKNLLNLEDSSYVLIKIKNNHSIDKTMLHNNKIYIKTSSFGSHRLVQILEFNGNIIKNTKRFPDYSTLENSLLPIEYIDCSHNYNNIDIKKILLLKIDNPLIIEYELEINIYIRNILSIIRNKNEKEVITITIKIQENNYLIYKSVKYSLFFGNYIVLEVIYEEKHKFINAYKSIFYIINIKTNKTIHKFSESKGLLTSFGDFSKNYNFYFINDAIYIAQNNNLLNTRHEYIIPKENGVEKKNIVYIEKISMNYWEKIRLIFIGHEKYNKNGSYSYFKLLPKDMIKIIILDVIQFYSFK